MYREKRVSVVDKQYNCHIQKMVWLGEGCAEKQREGEQKGVREREKETRK